MAKKEETILVEQALAEETRVKRIYGCSEITIGFAWQGLGREIVDFATIDTKGIIRCYEIKVTMEDLKSKAKKSFYGHYNYLTVTKELYGKIEKSGIDLENYGIPCWVGIMCCDLSYQTREYRWECMRKPKKQDISVEQADMLKTSMIRSLYWKMDKYMNMVDGTSLKQCRKELSRCRKEKENISLRLKQMEHAIYEMQSVIRRKYNTGFHVYADFSADEWVGAISSLINETSKRHYK